MSEDTDGFDVEAAVSRATGRTGAGVTGADVQEAVDEDVQEDAGEDGAESSSTSTSSSDRNANFKEMLLSTEPDTDLESVESPYDPDAGGLNRIYRGFQKALGFSGAPAIVDLFIGTIEAVVGRDLAPGGDDEEESSTSSSSEEDGDLSAEARSVAQEVGGA